jgi:hypothetical protein
MVALLWDLAKAGVALVVEIVRDEVKSRRERRDAQPASGPRRHLKVVPK